MISGPSHTSSRRLLARLRDTMAGVGSAQERLDKIVTLIASGMVADVCSVYVLRAGQVLELFATEGLKITAVHVTRLRVGEGLVGDIAAHAVPLALSDARHHPNFAYRPETGEELFHSMMGVPIMRAGKVIGVIAVQNKKSRHFQEEELETLQTVAMVLAELVSAGELVDRSEILAVDGIGILPMRLDGVQLNAGVGRGHAVPHRPRVVLTKLVADDVEEELEALNVAVQAMHGALDEMLDRYLVTDGEHRDVLEAYRMIADDAGWLNRIKEAIRSGLTAPAAVQKVKDETHLRMSQISDAYLRERVQDLEDLANRLLQHLAGDGPAHAKVELPEHAVLIAKSMGPAELLDYDTSRLRGLLLEDGTPSSHVAIIARALDIPVIGRMPGLLDRIEPNDMVVVDADNAQVFVRPGEDVLDAFKENIKGREARKAEYANLSSLPAVSLDGVNISLKLNAGLLVDVQRLDATGADGVGLYRTEIPFMARSALPDVDAQTQLYERILDEAGDKPVTFRTLDAGGDKVLPYWSSPPEENPAMGHRAIRLTLDRPAILRQQLRALLRASAGRHLRVMFPMIAEVAEMDAARALLDLEVKNRTERGEELPTKIDVGAMLEVPALLFQLPALLPRLDFISVGSNDLLQFLFASDRSNPKMAERYDVLSQPVLVALKSLLEHANEAGVPVNICGEMGGRPLEVMTMIGLGFREFSMSPPSVGPIKAMVRSLDVSGFQPYLLRLAEKTDHSLRERLRVFAVDHNVQL